MYPIGGATQVDHLLGAMAWIVVEPPDIQVIYMYPIGGATQVDHLLGAMIWIVVDPPDTQVIYMYPIGEPPRKIICWVP